MKTSTVTAKGQVTLPKAIRKFLGIQKGDKVLFLKKGKDVIVRSGKRNILDFRGVVKTRKRLKDFTKIREKVMEVVA